MKVVNKKNPLSGDLLVRSQDRVIVGHVMESGSLHLQTKDMNLSIFMVRPDVLIPDLYTKERVWETDQGQIFEKVGIVPSL